MALLRTLRLWSVILCLTLLFSLSTTRSVWAQSAGATSGTITGAIKDPNGANIAGATIKFRNTETFLVREVKATEEGTFSVSQLPPGNYEITVQAEGFNNQITNQQLALGTTLLVNFNLTIGTSNDVVNVTADPFYANKTESSFNNGRDRIEDLPINRRNFLDFSLTSARVVADRVPVQGVAATSGLSFNGQSARFNNFTIDGLDNNDTGPGAVGAGFSQEAVQEFQVIADGFAAEFGRSSGGIVNIVTRGGTNDYHGVLFFFERNDKTSTRDVFTPTKPPYKQYQFGATLSGPIKKDRVLFFSSFERSSIKQNSIVTISDGTIAAARRQGFNISKGASPFPLDMTSFLTRVDLQANANNTLNVRYSYDGTVNGAFEPFGGLAEASTAGKRILKNSSIALNYLYINPGLNLTNEVRYLFRQSKQLVDPVVNDVQVSLIIPEGNVTFGSSLLIPNIRNTYTNQIVDNVSLSRNRQQIKFGIDFQDINLYKSNLPFFQQGQAIFSALALDPANPTSPVTTLSGLQAFDPSLRTPEQRAFLNKIQGGLGLPKGLSLADSAIPRTFVQGFGDATTGIDERIFSAYFQDDIRVSSNLLLKVGVRYDRNNVSQTPQNAGNFSPRLGISYKVAGVPKLSLRASYGLFFSTPLYGPLLASVLLDPRIGGPLRLAVVPFPSTIPIYAQPGHHFPAANTLPTSLKFIPQLSQIDANQPDLRNSYSQQISAGIDYLLGKNAGISITYNYVRGIKQFAVRNINPIVRPMATALLSATQGRVDNTLGNVLEFESAFDSYYHGVTFSFNRRFSNHYSILANYTYSKGIDDYLDFRTAIQETNDPLKIGDERSLSLQDVRNRFNLSGVWDLNYTTNKFLTGFKVSAIVNLNSGRPYNLLAGTDLNRNGDSPAGDRPRIGGVPLGRNAGITPGFAQIDLRLSRSISFKERYKIEGTVEAFNLTNRVNISDINRTFLPTSQGTFNLPTQKNGRYIVPASNFRNAFPSRQIQLGVRLSF